MAKAESCLKLGLTTFALVFLPILLCFSNKPAQALTASVGQPYHGRLVEGIPFPRQFQGYQLRNEDHTYTTPELIGALLDAIEGVQDKYPNTCDLYVGDFSKPGGGWMNGHRSHQNGRDVDLGMYVKGNRPLNTFINMNEENLDAPKTWCLIENLLRSQRVQYIFLDKKVQNVLYDYALGEGVDPVYLERLFGNVKGAIIQHVRNHQDHMHVRFYAPWSTMAAHLDEGDSQKRTAVEMAQQAYLPKKVNYYVKGTERNLDMLARSFGVSRRDLCRWNQIHGNEILSPGSCLVFYKRGFEMEPVNLAQSLRPDSVPETQVVRFASLRPTRTLSDAPVSIRSSVTRERKYSEPVAASYTAQRDDTLERTAKSNTRERKSSAPVTTLYTVQKGDTLEGIAKSSGMDVKALLALNGLKKRTALKKGDKLTLLASIDTASASDASPSASSSGNSGNKASSDSGSSAYVAKKGETLARIAKANGVSLDTLCKINKIKQNTSLKPGQKILLAKVDTSPKTSLSDATAGISSSRSKDSSSQKSPTKASLSSKPSKSASKVADPPATKSAKESKALKESSKATPNASSASKSKKDSDSSVVKTSANKPAAAKPAVSKSSSDKSKLTEKVAKGTQPSSKKRVN